VFGGCLEQHSRLRLAARAPVGRDVVAHFDGIDCQLASEPCVHRLDNFTALLKPLYARVFLDTVWICFLTAACTLLVAYPIAYALVHAQNRLIKAAILIIAVTPLFLGEVVRTYSWIVVLGNNGFINSALLKLGLIDRPLQIMFTTFAVVTALVHVTLPVMVIMLAAALAHIDPTY